MKKCVITKNPCRICLEKVTNKTGLQCKGACKKWAHFSCLNYTPGKIHDIRKGYIIVKCPCPDCRTDDVKEIITSKSGFTCTNTECPAIKHPKCELPECHANKLQSDSQSPSLTSESSGSSISLPLAKLSASPKCTSPKRSHSSKYNPPTPESSTFPQSSPTSSKPIPDIKTETGPYHSKSATKKKRVPPCQTSHRPPPTPPNTRKPSSRGHKTPECSDNELPLKSKLPLHKNEFSPSLLSKRSPGSLSSKHSTPPKPLPPPNKPLPALKTDICPEYSKCPLCPNCPTSQFSSNTCIPSIRPESPTALLPHPPPPSEPIPLCLGAQPPRTESLHTDLPPPSIWPSIRMKVDSTPKVSEEKKGIHQSSVAKQQSMSDTNLSSAKANIENLKDQKCSSDAKLCTENRKAILSAVEQMCATVGQLTNQIKDLTCQMLNQMEKNC